MNAKINFLITFLLVIMITGCDVNNSSENSEPNNEIKKDLNIPTIISNSDCDPGEGIPCSPYPEYYLDPPSLLNPTNNSLQESTTTFTWDNPSSNPSLARYNLVIDNNSNFLSPEFSYSGLTGESKTVTGLSRNTTYYWRVVAYDPNPPIFPALECCYSSVSSTRSVKVRPETPLVTPSVQALAPKLSWNSVPGAVEYEIIRIAHSYPGVTTTLFTTTSTNYLDTSISFPVLTTTGFPAFGYRVVAKNSNGWPSTATNDKYFKEDTGGGGRGF